MYFYCYVMYSFVSLSILIVMYVPFWVFCVIVCSVYCLYVGQMCTVLLTPGVNPVAFNKYIIISVCHVSSLEHT